MSVAPSRTVIVNADDFGQSAGVNRGIVRSHEHGIVTSASLMVRWPAAPEAAGYARSHPKLSVGLHLDLGEWIFRDDAWVPLYEVVDTANEAAVRNEVARQLAEFQRQMCRPPTHIDSHQHVHLREPARTIVLEAAAKLRVPVRRCTPTVRYCGDFYGQGEGGAPYAEGISVENLVAMLKSLPPGATELSCHPADGDDLNTMYRFERNHEVRTLCDPCVAESIAALGIRLVSFAEVDVGTPAEPA